MEITIQQVKDIITKNYPIYDGEVNVTNEIELEKLLNQLENSYEELVDEYLEKNKKAIFQYIQNEAPQTAKTKQDLQNIYVIQSLRKNLINYKKPTKEMIHSALWGFRRLSNTNTNYYD